MNIDHVVLWVDDTGRSLDFYTGILGLTPVRVQEHEAGKAPFPSVRLNDETIIDLMNREMLSSAQRAAGTDAGGQALNHVCLCMNAPEYAAVMSRLSDQGVEISPGSEKSFGARGYTANSAYFHDPDGNVIEIRHYD